jgi:hypothetical protein
MINGEKPRNESEARMKEQIEEMEKKGTVIDNPAM